jgi:hypothetical protein
MMLMVTVMAMVMVTVNSDGDINHYSAGCVGDGYDDGQMVMVRW